MKFTEEGKELRHLKKIIKKHAKEIAVDMAKLEMTNKHLKDNFKSNSRELEYLHDRIKKLEQDGYRSDKGRFDTYATFREGQENLPINIPDDARRAVQTETKEAKYRTHSHFSTTQRQEHSGVDRADLLIMCNKIKEDVRKSLNDTLTHNRLHSVSIQDDGRAISKRENTSEVRNSIDMYRKAYGNSMHVSPLRNFKHTSNKNSSKHGVLGSDLSCRSVAKTLDQGSNIDMNSTTQLQHLNDKTRQYEIKVKENNLVSFSPFTSCKSKDRELASHSKKKRLKSKQALSKIDKIYKELQSMERELRHPSEQL